MNTYVLVVTLGCLLFGYNANAELQDSETKKDGKSKHNFLMWYS